MPVSATHPSRRRSGAAHLVHGAPPGRCHPGRAIVTMTLVTRTFDAHRADVKNPGRLSTAGPDPSQRASSISFQPASSIPRQPREPRPPRLNHVQPARTGLTWRLCAIRRVLGTIAPTSHHTAHTHHTIRHLPNTGTRRHTRQHDQRATPPSATREPARPGASRSQAPHGARRSPASASHRQPPTRPPPPPMTAPPGRGPGGHARAATSARLAPIQRPASPQSAPAPGIFRVPGGIRWRR